MGMCDDMNIAETYEKNRKALNEYRWFRQTNSSLPKCEEIKLEKIPTELIRRSDVLERPFFLDLEKPLLLKSEYNTYHIEYVVDNVRKSERYGGDNHVYLWYEKIEELVALLCVFDIRVELEEEKLFFLIGEDALNKYYPFDFKREVGIDYESMPVQSFCVEEIKRLIIDNPTDWYSGNIFMAGILDGHPNLLTMKGFGCSGFPLIYETVFMGRGVFESKEYVETCYASHIVKEFKSMFYSRFSDDGIIYPVPDWEKFWKLLDKKISGGAYTPGNWLRAMFISYAEVLWGVRNSRIAPVIRITSHYNGRKILEGERIPFFEEFRYIRQIEIVRNSIMRIASRINTYITSQKTINRPLVNWYFDIVVRDTYIPECQRHYGPKWILPIEDTPNRRSIRFEDLKLYPEDSLGTLCAFLDIPFDETMWYTTVNGKRSAYFSPGVNENVDDYNPRPAKDYKPDIMSDRDIYRLELLYKQELDTFGYKYHRYDGKDYSKEEIRAFFLESFRFEDKIYNRKLLETLPLWKERLHENVNYRLSHGFDETEEGYPLVPVLPLDIETGINNFLEYGGIITDKDVARVHIPPKSHDTKSKDIEKLFSDDSITELYKQIQAEKDYFENELLSIEDDIVHKYKKLYLYGAGTDGIQIAKRLITILDKEEMSFIDRDESKYGKCIGEKLLCHPVATAYGASKDTMILITASSVVDDIVNDLSSEENQTEDRLKNVVIQDRYCVVYSKLKAKDFLISNYIIVKEAFETLEDATSKYYLYKMIWDINYQNEIGKILSFPAYEDNVEINRILGKYFDNRTNRTSTTIVCGFFTEDILRDIVYVLKLDNNVVIYEGNRLFAEYLKKRYKKEINNKKIFIKNVVPDSIDYRVFLDKYDGGFGHYGYLDYISDDSVICEKIDNYYDENNEYVGTIVVSLDNASTNALMGMKNTIKNNCPIILLQCGGHPYAAPDEYVWHVISLINSWELGYHFAIRYLPRKRYWLIAYTC